MKKQTAVEWLIEQIENGKIHIIYSDKIQSIKCIHEIVEQAKQMESDQIVDAYKADLHPCSDEDAEQYYKETYTNEK
jgi:hypothetical protein